MKRVNSFIEPPGLFHVDEAQMERINAASGGHSPAAQWGCIEPIFGSDSVGCPKYCEDTVDWNAFTRKHSPADALFEEGTKSGSRSEAIRSGDLFCRQPRCKERQPASLLRGGVFAKASWILDVAPALKCKLIGFDEDPVFGEL